MPLSDQKRCIVRLVITPKSSRSCKKTLGAYTSDMQAPTTESESGRLVHIVLAQSYLVYLVAIVVGFALDIVKPIPFSFPALMPLGMLCIMFGTFLVIWAQKAAHKSEKARNDSATEKICRDHFCVGPYVFTRSPTQYGLSFMALGLAFVYGSFFMVIFTGIAFLLGRFVFIRKQEFHLERKYGDPYVEYKKHVKF